MQQIVRPIFMLVVLLASLGCAQAEHERVVIESNGQTFTFDVEVVREEAERARGLMFRREMADNHGMLFDYNPAQLVAFWMKNTYISLDIIFIGPDGRIIRIAERTRPLSLEPIPSGGVTRGVLEINGGLSRRLGIKDGDLVRHDIFGMAP